MRATRCETGQRRTDVAKHERKEEGKGDDGERRWIDLAIARDAVRLDDRLKRRRDLVRQKVPAATKPERKKSDRQRPTRTSAVRASCLSKC